jgi:DNA primase
MARLEDIISKDHTLRGSGNYLRSLEHDSLVIDLNKQVWYWNSKGIAGDMFDWLIKVKGYSKAYARDIVGKHDPRLVLTRGMEKKERVFVNENLVDAFFNLGKFYRDYWYSRGYTDATIDLFKLGYSGDWYTIPIFIDGKFRNFQCRTPDKRMRHWYRGVGPLPFNMDYVKNKEFFVLTEGPVDAIMLMQHDIPAMATNTGAGYFEREWVGKFRNLKEVWIIHDNDKAGQKGARSIGKIFGTVARCYCFDGFVDGYDASDYFRDGGTRDGFEQLVEGNGKYWFEI